MFYFILTVTIMLAPTNAVRQAHPLHHFTITSNAAYGDGGSCQEAALKMESYIEAHLPPASGITGNYDCLTSEVVES